MKGLIGAGVLLCMRVTDHPSSSSVPESRLLIILSPTRALLTCWPENYLLGEGVALRIIGLLAASMISILQMPAETPPLCVTIKILAGFLPLGAELSLVENYCWRSPSFLIVRQNANEQMCCLGWSTGVEKLAVSKYANNTAIIFDYLEVLCYM